MNLSLFSIYTVVFAVLFNLSSCQRNNDVGPGYKFDLFKNTPSYLLAKAVEIEDTDAMRKFVTKDSIQIDYQESRFGNTLLTLSIINKKDLSTRMLLDLGANPDLRSKNNSSPFLEACSYSFFLNNTRGTLESLIKHGADVNSIQLDTTLDQFGVRKHFVTSALEIACSYGNLESVTVLVENGASLTRYGKNEDAILSTAILSGHLEIVKYLMITKNAPIPDYVIIRQKGKKYERKMTIKDILLEEHYADNPSKEALKNEILAYLVRNGKK